MDFKIRFISEEEVGVLEDFLYEAIYVPEGESAPPRSIINQPELQVYIMNDYGHIDNNTPSFAISVYKDYRGLGTGTDLMKEMLRVLKARGYKQASLSVQKANYAVRMYQKVGFQIVDENEEEYIMLCQL